MYKRSSIEQIVYIEDDVADYSLLEEMLLHTGLKGASLSRFDRLSTGLQYLSENQPDVILLDLSLPDSTGALSVERVREKCPGCAVVIVTGSDDGAHVEKILHLGAQDYLTKGKFDGEVLERAIRYSVERAHLLGELEEEKRKAQDASKVKSHFLACMSHEIRTPLNSIIGLADLLEEAESDQERARYINLFRRAGKHLLGLVDDVLDISKIESGELEISESEFDLLEAFESVAEVTRMSCQKKGLEFNFSCPLSKSVIYSDESKIRQIAFNLVSNAIKFTKKGVVSLNLNVIDSELYIEVSDSGVGIPKSRLDSIFDPFVQVETRLNKRSGGTGLGLAICKRFVLRLGGDVDVWSDEGVGTTFLVKLPVKIVSEDNFFEASNNVRAAERFPRRVLTEGKPNILVVEDIEDNRLVFEAYFMKSDYHVDFAKDGFEGFGLVTRNEYDLILLDIQMPELDGYSLTGQIRKWEKENKRKRTTIVALSAHADEDEVSKAKAADLDGYLTKPILRDDLLDYLRNIFNVSSGTEKK